ncbi:Uma2 family endonuclease [Aphanizomenon sp. CS-733/32]|uniref:Uma2 family endonuclease n=1 Tax=Aphanizomenon sp. CS-733/32 TaxID=3021715 RepID=UPI002FEE40AE
MLTNIRQITVNEYHKMAEMGIFHPEERLELISGQIIKMAAKGTAHEAAITRTQRIFNQRLGDRVLIRTQSPIKQILQLLKPMLWIMKIIIPNHQKSF